MKSPDKDSHFSCVLVDPPLKQIPICTPALGISCIKSYVEKHSTIQVHCHDASIAVFESLRSMKSLDPMLEACPDIFPISLGNDKMGAFSVAEVYDRIDQIRNASTFGCTERSNETIDYMGFFNKAVVTPFNLCCKQYLSDDTLDSMELSTLFGVPSLMESQPDVIGFSVTYSEQLIAALLMARMVKKIRPELPVVLGGAMLSFMDRDERDKILSFEGLVDFLVVGDGEEAVLQLLCALKEENGRYEEIPNLVFMKDDEPHATERRPVAELDSLPYPDFSDFPMTRYHVPVPYLPMLSAKGCSWGKCSFCSYDNNYFKTHRTRSVHSIVSEMRRNRDVYGCSHFTFTDSGISAKYLQELARALKAESLNVYYNCMTKPCRELTDPAVCSLLRESGLVQVSIGVESFTNRLLKLMNKGTTAEISSRVIKALSGSDIDVECFYIMGFPTQTREELVQEIRCIFSMLPYIWQIGFSSFHLLHDSPIYRNPAKYQIRVHEERANVLFCKNGFSVKDDEVLFSIAPEYMQREESYLWANIVEEAAASLATMNDPNKEITGEHRFIRKTIAPERIPDGEFPKAGPRFGKSATELETLISETRDKVSCIQDAHELDPVLMSYLTALFNKRLNAALEKRSVMAHE